MGSLPLIGDAISVEVSERSRPGLVLVGDAVTVPVSEASSSLVLVWDAVPISGARGEALQLVGDAISVVIGVPSAITGGIPGVAVCGARVAAAAISATRVAASVTVASIAGWR